MTGRPDLIPTLSEEDFRDYYWLKAELVEFCRQQGLPTSGSKREVSERIAHFLKTGEILLASRRSSSRSGGAMPETFTRETVIGSSWRCSQALRAFFEAELGPSFHFNQVMRDFIKDGAGRTLQEAIEAWEEEKRCPKPKGEIAPQFEYMWHMRAYFEENPDGTREDALRAWHEKKARRKSSGC